MKSLNLSRGGRVVIPADARKALGMVEGEPIMGELRNGEFVLTTRKAQLERARRLFQQYCPPQPGRSLVDEFIAERHAEAERE